MRLMLQRAAVPDPSRVDLRGRCLSELRGMRLNVHTRAEVNSSFTDLAHLCDLDKLIREGFRGDW